MTSTGKALIVRVPDGLPPKLVQEQLPLPIPEAGEVLVKVSHVAQNPVDIQLFDTNAFGDGAVLGCDFVGEVVELGARVTRLNKGDVIAGLIFGGERPGLGGYREHTIADAQVSFKIPPNITRDQASTVPLAAATAWLALLTERCLNLDRSKARNTPVLVWGGSSSVGLYTVQLASVLGFTVVATCSPRNADLVRSSGATHVFDYRDNSVIEKIQEVAPGLEHIFDTIGNETSSAFSSQAFGGRKGNLCTVRPGKANCENVTSNTHVSDVLVWTAFLKDHSYGEYQWPASQEDHDLARELFDKLPQWLEQGTIKPNNTKVLIGLDSVPQGFQEYRDDVISAYKIVYEL